MHPGTDTTRRYAADTRREFLRVFVAAALLLSMVAVTHFLADRSSRRLTQESAERLNVALGGEAIARNLEGVVSDLRFLAEITERAAFFGASSEAERRRLARDFLAFSRNRGVYDQLRLLDERGQEVLRVNFAPGGPRLVPATELQPKAARYYFKQAFALPRGGVYVSPLDLNVEHGRIERPSKPVLRFAAPVGDGRTTKRGLLVLNYLGETLLAAFREATSNIADHVALLNAEGYWLSNPHRTDEWGFMYDNGRTFAKAHPEAWEHIRRAESDQRRLPAGLYTFLTVRPLQLAAGRGVPVNGDPGAELLWKVVSFVPARGLPGLSGFIARHWSLYVSMLALLAVGSAALARARVRHAGAMVLVEFERRFRGILERIELLAVGLDHGGRIQFCNDAFLTHTSRRREEILGQDWFEEFVPEAARAREQSRFVRMMAGEIEPAATESCVEPPEGERRRIAWNDTLVLDSQGRIAGLTRIGEDVTEARAAEEELRMLSRAVEQSPGAVMIASPEGAIEYVNPKFTEITGYRLEEVRGLNPRLLKSGHTSAAEYRELWRTISSGGEWRGVFCNRRKSGELYWEAVVISPVRDAEGRIAHYLAVKEDITERRRMEERFGQVVESSPYALVMTDERGEIVLVNSRTEELFGYPREALIGQSVELLLPEAVRRQHGALRARYAEAPRRRAMGSGRDLVAQRRDGSVFPVEVGLSPIEASEGRLMLAAVVDISERKRLQAELAERDREVARNQALAVIGRMANMVAHDLRNPLSSIKMGLQMLGQSGAASWGPEERELHAIALEQVRFMEGILKDLLAYSREQPLSPKWLAIEEVIDGALDAVRHQAAEHGIRIAAHLDPDLPPVHGDPDKLRQVFANLATNAVQATEDVEGRARVVEIRAALDPEADPPAMRIEVRDSGCGLAEEDSERLFEPFYTTRATGTGLGLAIVRRIIERHGGRVALERGTLHGARAVITLPLGPPAAASDAAA